MRLVKCAAEPRQIGDSSKAAIGRAARVLRWSYSRTKDVWYGDAKRIRSEEMDALRSIERERNIAALAGDYRRHIAQLSALRARLDHLDPDFHRADVAAIGWLLERLRNP